MHPGAEYRDENKIVWAQPGSLRHLIIFTFAFSLKNMIGIIKYQAGNLASVSNALDRLQADYIISNNTDELDKTDAIIFPGVGHAAAAMDDLRSKNLDAWLKNTKKPVLGICLGMQLFYDSSEEGDCEALGIIPGRLKRFDSTKAKVPHMGWNSFESIKKHNLLTGIEEKHFLYYVHGYYAPLSDYTLASCNYIQNFTAVTAKDNFIGVQFHPEKSGQVGSLLLQNFLDMVNSHERSDG